MIELRGDHVLLRGFRPEEVVVFVRPEEVTEVWTFRRDNGGPWKVSAIQQAA